MDDKQVDGGSVEGTATNANGGASGNQSDQQPSFDAAKLQETLDAFKEGMETLSKRVDGLQGVKDKQANELDGLKGKIAEYEQLKERLGSADSAMEQLELRETLAKMNKQLESLSSISTQATGTGASGAADAAQAIREAGLDMNDPKVALLASKTYANDAEVNAAIVSHLRAKTKAPSPTQAQQLAETGEAEKGKNDQEKVDDYIKNMRAARGKPGELRRIKEQAIKDGVPVHQIDFS